MVQCARAIDREEAPTLAGQAATVETAHPGSQLSLGSSDDVRLPLGAVLSFRPGPEPVRSGRVAQSVRDRSQWGSTRFGLRQSHFRDPSVLTRIPHETSTHTLTDQELCKCSQRRGRPDCGGESNTARQGRTSTEEGARARGIRFLRLKGVRYRVPVYVD